MPAVLQRLVDFFVITFGITPPRPGQERLAQFFILTLMALIVITVLGGALFFSRVLF